MSLTTFLEALSAEDLIEQSTMIANWVSAIATCFGVLLAGAVGLVGFRIYRIESARDQSTAGLQAQRDEANRRSQAVRVCAWTDFDNGRRFHIANLSDLPVYDVHVKVRNMPRDPDAEWHYYVGHKAIQVLPPGQTLVLRPQGLPSSGGWEIAIVFRDSGTHDWFRIWNGDLQDWKHPGQRFPLVVTATEIYVGDLNLSDPDGPVMIRD